MGRETSALVPPKRLPPQLAERARAVGAGSADSCVLAYGEEKSVRIRGRSHSLRDKGHDPSRILWSFNNSTPTLPPCLPTDAHQDLFIPPTHFDRLLTSIKSRKNLILQGPPGTGKTFIARRIAWCLIGHKDDGPIEMIQFHQSYAYEDFVEGFRPAETGGFTRKPGVFHRFCERARTNPDTPHILSSTRSTGATCRASSANFSC